MTLLSERDYEVAVIAEEAEARGYPFISQAQAADFFLTARRRQTPQDAYELRFPWGSQILLVWEK